MINRDFAKKQIARMGQFRGFPKEFPEAIGELIDVLAKAETEELAKETIARFMESANSETLCPFPADIRSALADVTNEKLGEIRPDPNCHKCKGIGDIIINRGGMTAAKHCDCWARRPEPVYTPQPGDEPIGEDFKRQIAKAAKTLGR